MTKEDLIALEGELGMKLKCRLGIHRWGNWNQIKIYNIYYVKRCLLCGKKIFGVQLTVSQIDRISEEDLFQYNSFCIKRNKIKGIK